MYAFGKFGDIKTDEGNASNAAMRAMANELKKIDGVTVEIHPRLRVDWGTIQAQIDADIARIRASNPMAHISLIAFGVAPV
jgi:hypothetical protein